jgi:SAM-dependent methyltransferase
MDTQPQQVYWDEIAEEYQRLTRISTDDFHFGPLLPGDLELQILPEITSGMSCLELGCGAAQNSIALARRGAVCTAIDISSHQIQHAAQLAAAAKVDIELHCLPLEETLDWPGGQYDLVHSVFALPFIADPEGFVRQGAAKVSPGGTFLLATAHPVFSGEWLEVEDEEMGIFLPSYFEPDDDLRQTSDGRIIGSSAYPISMISDWIHSAGLRNLRLWEPKPLPLDALDRAPYRSPAWADLHPKLAVAPVAVIYRAKAPRD